VPAGWPPATKSTVPIPGCGRRCNTIPLGNFWASAAT
jgi:hypothetical protein